MATEIVKSAGRVMQVLECFEEYRRPLTITEISRALGIPQSSTSALVKSLVRMGYLAHTDGMRTIAPTLRVARLGHWTQHTLIEPEKLFELLEKLHQRTGETVVLGATKDNYVQYIHVIQSTRDVRFYMKPGAERPICFTAVGQLLLSVMSDDEIERRIHRTNYERDSDRKPVVLNDLFRIITRVRRQGYAMTVNQATPGGGVVAVLLPLRPGEQELAVGLAAPADRLIRQKNQMLDELRRGVLEYFGEPAPMPAPRIKKPKSKRRKAK